MITKAPDWSAEETRLLEPYIRGVVRHRYESGAQAAREYLRELGRLRRQYPKAKWLRVQRGFRVVQSRINRQAKEFGRQGRSPGWTAPETQIANRYVHALLRGEYRSAKQVALACFGELTRQYRRRRGKSGFPTRRSYLGVYYRVTENARRLGLARFRGAWTEPELRVIDGFARAVAEGRLRDNKQASRLCAEEFDRLRRKYPKAVWLRVHRHWRGIYNVLSQRSRDLGRRPTGHTWSPAEKRLRDHYAGQIARGSYREAKAAAGELLKRLNELQTKRPELAWHRRSWQFHNVHSLLCQRAHELGWSRQHVAWSPAEDLIVNRYVRRLVSGGFPHAKAAVAACKTDLDRLHRAHPNAPWAEKRRTRIAVKGRILQLARVTGQTRPHSWWTIPEKRIVERYARALSKGRFPSLTKATEQCHRAIERFQRQLRSRRPDLPPTPVPRPAGTLYSMLSKRSLELRRTRRARPHGVRS